MHMLHPELFVEKPCKVQIETAGKYTQGMTIVDDADAEHANVRLLGALCGCRSV